MLCVILFTKAHSWLEKRGFFWYTIWKDLHAFKNIHEVFYIYWTDYCYSLRLFTTRTKGKQTRKLLILLLRHFILRINNFSTFLFVKKRDKVETHCHWPIFLPSTHKKIAYNLKVVTFSIPICEEIRCTFPFKMKCD